RSARAHRESGADCGLARRARSPGSYRSRYAGGSERRLEELGRRRGRSRPLGGRVALDRGDPASVDESLAEPVAVAAHALVELGQVGWVRVGGRLLAVLDGSRPLPVRVAVEPSTEVSRAVGIHGRRLKGSGGEAPPRLASRR